MTSQAITTIAGLEAIYGHPAGAAVTKEVDFLTDQYRAFAERAPFVVIGTVGPEGTDCSPRGDPVGFIRVVDRKTLLIPDRRGNNRIDTLRNLVADPRCSLLFLIPGVNETLRINGRARILVDPDLAATFTVNGKVPQTLLSVTVDRVYYQCAKALIRSRLWSADAQAERSSVPTGGQILQEITQGGVNAREYDDAYPERIRQTIY